MATDDTRIKEALWHPLTLRRMKHIKAGRVIPGLTKPIHRSFTPSREAIASITKFYQTGDMDILCNLLRANPFHVNLPSLIHQLWWLKVLSNFIDDDAGRCTNPDFDISPTHEFLWIKRREFKIKSPWKSFPVGTWKAAHQALVDLVQAWVQGLLPGYSLQKNPYMTKTIKSCKKLGRKETRSSYVMYGEAGVRLMIFYGMLEDLERPPNGEFTEEDFKKGSTEDPTTFETRTIKLVQRVHQEFGLGSQYTIAGCSSAPLKIRPLPKSIARTIAKQAMGARTVNKRNLLCSLLAVYEDPKKGDPKNFKAIKDSINREEGEYPENIPPQFRKSPQRRKPNNPQ